MRFRPPLPIAIERLTGGSADGWEHSHRECRECGTNVESGVMACPECGADVTVYRW